jgi:excisionase family DNA binding protein
MKHAEGSADIASGIKPESLTMTATPQAGDSPALLDVRAVAALLDCSTRHVYRLADAERMPKPLKLGTLLRWRRADLDAWLADGCPAVRESEVGGR